MHSTSLLLPIHKPSRLLTTLTPPSHTPFFRTNTANLLPPTPLSTPLPPHITHLHNAHIFSTLAFNIPPTHTNPTQSPHNLSPTHKQPAPSLLTQHKLPYQNTPPPPAPTNTLKLSSLTCPQALFAFTPHTNLSLLNNALNTLPFFLNFTANA